VDPRRGDSEIDRAIAKASSGGAGENGRRKIIRAPLSPRDRYFSEVEQRVAAEGDWLLTAPLAEALSTSRRGIYEVMRSSDRGAKSVVAEIRAILVLFIKSLEELDSTGIGSYSRTLSEKPFWNGLALSPGLDVASSSPSEIRDILRSVHENALRASRIVVPNKSKAFRLWLARNVTSGSLRRNVMVAMGEKLALSDFKTRDVQKDIERMTKEDVDFDVLVRTMQQLREDLEGREFSLGVKPSGEGSSVFHNLVPARPSYPVEVVDEEMMLQSFGENFFSVLRDGRARKIYDVLAKNGCGNRIDSRVAAARAFDVEDPSPKFMCDNVFTPLYALIKRIEDEWKLKLMDGKANRRMEKGKVRSDDEILKDAARKDFTIRRIRCGGGGQPGLDLVIENRLKAMEGWITEMASPGALLEKILWIMFRSGLGVEFTKDDLVGLLVKDGVVVTDKQVADAIVRGTKGGGRLTKKSKGTLFEVNARRGISGKKNCDGKLITNIFHYSIRP